MNYPYKALRELLMNAVMHRDYQSHMPTRLYQYDKHIEIMNPGGLYGQARPENFPFVNDYRNSVVAGMMRVLNYVNMFNHGITDVQDQLKANNSPAAEFNTGYVTAFSVIVREPNLVNFTMDGKVDDRVVSFDYQEFVKELYQNFTSMDKVNDKVIMLVLLLNESQVSVKEMMEACNMKSRMTFDRTVLRPFLDAGLIAPIYPHNPRHPKQKYTLTKTGLKWLDKVKSTKI